MSFRSQVCPRLRLQSLQHTEICSLIKSPALQVWDLSHSKSLEAAHAMKEQTSKQKCASNMALALSAAVNCSSSAKQSPLHIAVEADCKYSIKVIHSAADLWALLQSISTFLF